MPRRGLRGLTGSAGATIILHAELVLRAAKH